MCGFIKFSTCNLIKDVSLFGTLFNIGPSNSTNIGVYNTDIHVSMVWN